MRLRGALSGFLLGACIAPAAAQNWPAHPLRLIVAEAAGGQPDLAARVIAESLARALGQAVRIENRPGDEGVQTAAGSRADGYTLLLAPSSALTLFPYTTDLLPYSPEDDFAGVAMVGAVAFVVVANPAINVKSLGDLITLAREPPPSLAYATAGPRTI